LDDDKRSFQKYVEQLPPIPNRFFTNDYYERNYAATREEIKSRVYGVAQNETLAAMFNSNMRKLDIAKIIKERKILFVNTRMTQLAEDHQTLGRYIISLVQDAVQGRTERDPVYLIVDEFQEFADAEKTPKLLRLMREYGGGVTIAHQNMYCAELDDATRNAISTNTSIKYASSPEAQDLNYMARDLRCNPEWLKEQHKSDTHAHFACYVRGMGLKHPFIAASQLGWIDTWPTMSDADYKALRAKNRVALQDETHKTIDNTKAASPEKTAEPNTHESIPAAQNAPQPQSKTPPSAGPTDSCDAASEW
jgi:hypothetical protein